MVKAAAQQEGTHEVNDLELLVPKELDKGNLVVAESVEELALDETFVGAVSWSSSLE